MVLGIDEYYSTYEKTNIPIIISIKSLHKEL